MSKHAHRSGRISSKNIRRLVLISAILAVFALGATAAVSLRASQAKNSTTPAGSAQANAAPINLRSRAGGQAVPLDPQTGQVRPLTQEEAQKLAAGLKQVVNQSTDGLQSVRHADGSISMDLQGRFQNVAVARRDEDGNVIQSCIDNREAAAAFFEIDPKLLGVQGTAASSKAGSLASEKGGNR